jgi:hypothetical protein
MRQAALLFEQISPHAVHANPPISLVIVVSAENLKTLSRNAEFERGWGPVSGYNRCMSIAFNELEKQARALPLKEKAALARVLIEELDMSVDADAERLWIDEAKRRHDGFLKGELEALPGDEVMDRARKRLR